MSRSEERAFHGLLTSIEEEMPFESGFYNDTYRDRRITARMRRTDRDEYAACSDSGKKCADGREPYSVAMLAIEDADIEDRRIEVTGTDINPDILEDAREGVYEASQTSDIAAFFGDEPSQYVAREDDRFVVRDSVRERVRCSG